MTSLLYDPPGSLVKNEPDPIIVSLCSMALSEFWLFENDGSTKLTRSLLTLINIDKKYFIKEMKEHYLLLPCFSFALIESHLHVLRKKH